MKEQGLFHTPDSREAVYSDTLELDLSSVQPSLAGPKRPQDRILLGDLKRSFLGQLPDLKAPSGGDGGGVSVAEPQVEVGIATELGGHEFTLQDGSVVIAAITSCTNTSNPSVMVAAGLLAKKAVERGLRTQPWVKTSLAPGSKVVTDYLNESGLMSFLEVLKFYVVGYGCTTCIGNSGPLPQPVSDAVRQGNLVAVSVLSGNRNFEGRISSDVRANYLASPPLVVAYALAGRIDVDLYTEPLGTDKQGQPVFLEEIWPTREEVVTEVVGQAVQPGDVHQGVRRSVRGRRAVERHAGSRRGYLCLGRGFHLRQIAALFRRSSGRASSVVGYRERQGSGTGWRLHHHRPHLPGRGFQGGQPSGSIPHRAGSRAAGFQFLRLAPGQPRGHDAGNIRQRAISQQARTVARRWIHPPSA